MGFGFFTFVNFNQWSLNGRIDLRSCKVLKGFLAASITQTRGLIFYKTTHIRLFDSILKLRDSCFI